MLFLIYPHSFTHTSPLHLLRLLISKQQTVSISSYMFMKQRPQRARGKLITEAGATTTVAMGILVMDPSLESLTFPYTGVRAHVDILCTQTCRYTHIHTWRELNTVPFLWAKLHFG